MVASLLADERNFLEARSARARGQCARFDRQVRERLAGGKIPKCALHALLQNAVPCNELLTLIVLEAFGRSIHSSLTIQGLPQRNETQFALEVTLPEGCHGGIKVIQSVAQCCGIGQV